MEKPKHTFWATQYYFSHLLSLFSFTSGIPVTQISFVVVPHILEDPFIYFIFCFISVVKIGSFLLSSSLLILPSVPTILLWVHILSFFIQLLYFSVLKFLFGFLYLLFLCWAFLFLFLRLSVFPLLLCIVACWSLFLMAALRSLSDNSGSTPSHPSRSSQSTDLSSLCLTYICHQRLDKNDLWPQEPLPKALQEGFKVWLWYIAQHI